MNIKFPCDVCKIKCDGCDYGCEELDDYLYMGSATCEEMKDYVNGNGW